MPTTRRSFLKQTSILAAASALPARWVHAEDLPLDRKVKLRFAVASDLHYRPGGSRHPGGPEAAEALVGWINKEKEDKGLDAFFVNGDVSHDRAALLPEVRDRYFSKLTMPYYCGKGNHDYVDEQPGSASESWESIWGYPANHSFKLNDFAFVIADSSATRNFRPYLPADIDFLRAAFEKHRNAPAIFVLIHIAQRKEGKEGWPQFGVHGSRAKEAEAVMDLIESTPNVKAIFHGHNHNEAGLWTSGDKRYLFTSHTGGWWGGPRGYRILEVDDQHRMVTYQVNAEEGGELNRNALS